MILNTSKQETEVLTTLRKAAITLVVLGENASAQLLQQLGEEDVNRVSREVAKITAITAEQAESVLEEFHYISNAGDYVARGGIDFARKLLMKAFEPEHAKRLLDRLTKALGSDAASFDAIQKADPQQLAKFIHNEHPQTIALVLSHLNYTQAAALLTSLPAAMRADVSQRMASLDQISPEIIHKIAAVIGQKLKALGEFSRESYGGVRAVAEMLNRLDSTSGRKSSTHRSAGHQPRRDHPPPHVRFRRPASDRSAHLRKSSPRSIAKSYHRLKGTSEQLRNHMLRLACRSARTTCCPRDMEALGPVKIKEVEQSQQQIIARTPVGKRRRSQPEGSRRRAICRQSHPVDGDHEVAPVSWRRVGPSRGHLTAASQPPDDAKRLAPAQRRPSSGARCPRRGPPRR